MWTEKQRDFFVQEVDRFLSATGIRREVFATALGLNRSGLYRSHLARAEGYDERILSRMNGRNLVPLARVLQLNDTGYLALRRLFGTVQQEILENHLLFLPEPSARTSLREAGTEEESRTMASLSPTKR
jgi:hypothetical protein